MNQKKRDAVESIASLCQSFLALASAFFRVFLCFSMFLNKRVASVFSFGCLIKLGRHTTFKI